MSTRDHESNIDVRFSTTGGISRGAAVTTTTEGVPRWFYLAGENQWYSPAEDSPPFLAAQPTGTAPPPPPPTTATARPVHTPRPPTTTCVSATNNAVLNAISNATLLLKAKTDSKK